MEKCCLYSRRHHLPKNKEVKVCEILFMLPFVIYLTSHIYSFPEILASDESLLKLSLSNDNFQTGLLNPDCQNLEQKLKNVGKIIQMLITEVGSISSFTNKNVFETTSEANKYVFFRNRRKVTRLCLLYINLEPFVTEEAGFTTIYRVYKYCHHCPEEGLNWTVSPTLMLSKVCDSSVL